ncbi:MAG TPA: HAD family hydrolase [Kiritimatiellia bacterium]|nr:HAD family hydrolase [Kiritimatiellia bacterium]HRR34412.1 HAD family hydrolase [Kiritimatiellia bacterium]HRU71648.1 HAD family hydrolase [Kiritimatiellia bacterium]
MNEGSPATSASKDTLLITDFDGTLYRGSCPFLFRGIANADLMGALCLRNIFKVRRLLRLLDGMIRLRCLERRVRYAYKRGELTLSDADVQLVKFCESHILAECGLTDIDWGVRLISGFCYRAAWRCFSALKNRCDFVIVSKSFEFVLEKVCHRAARYGIEMRYCGNAAGYRATAPRPDSVTTKEDKSARIRDLLAGGTYKKAIVIGDTEDDIAMRDAAVEVLGKPNVLFICMHAKDPKIAVAADRVFKSWRAARVFLQSERPTSKF